MNRKSHLRTLRKHRGLQREILRKSARALRYAVAAFEPPYDPWCVAEHLGVPVEAKPLTGIDGYVDLNDGGPKVFVASNCSRERQRFTLAHELGHVLLIQACRDGKQPLTYGLRRYRARQIPTDFSSDPEEERLCNYFAAELLMPESDMIQFTARGAVRPAIIVGLSKLFRVSLQAAATRLFALSSADSAMSLWARRPWPTCRWVVGEMPKHVHASIATFLQHDTSRSDVFGWNHRGDELKAEILQIGNGDVTLVAVMDAAGCPVPGQLSLPRM